MMMTMCCQQNSSTVELVVDTCDGRRVVAIYYTVRQLQPFNSVTSIYCTTWSYSCAPAGKYFDWHSAPRGTFAAAELFNCLLLLLISGVSSVTARTTDMSLKCLNDYVHESKHLRAQQPPLRDLLTCSIDSAIDVQATSFALRWSRDVSFSYFHLQMDDSYSERRTAAAQGGTWRPRHELRPCSSWAEV